jgi:hypothetical protein
MDYYENPVEGIIMIIIAIISSIAGSILGVSATMVYHQMQTDRLKCDSIAALRKQAEDSFRAGYTRGMSDAQSTKEEKRIAQQTMDKVLINH